MQCTNLNIDTIYYEISGFCNAKCRYCPTGNGVTRDCPSRFIPIDDFSSGLKKLYKLGILNNSTFLGLYNWGDPLLHPHLDEIIKILKEMDQSFALSTNGSFIPNCLKSSHLENLSFCRVSLPGFSQESYNRIHQLDFDKVLHNIDVLYELVPPDTLEIGIFAYKFNLEEIYNASEYFSKKNIRYRILMPFLIDCENAIEYINDKISSTEKQKIEQDLFTDYIKPMVQLREGDSYCIPLQNQLTIDEYNNILTCCNLSKKSDYYTIGSLLKMTIKDIRDAKTQGRLICSKCMSAGFPYWYKHNCQYLPPELLRYNNYTFCYIDTGNGFSECQKISNNIPPKALNDSFHIHFDCSKYTDIQSLRWDPIEGLLCGITIDDIRLTMANGKCLSFNLKKLKTNGESLSGNRFRFSTTDPWVIIPAKGSITDVYISGTWIINSADDTMADQNQIVNQS
jgi:molybdenum cofactor biosynthesis enzyme MoaA